jgi:hypothetical protein
MAKVLQHKRSIDKILFDQVKGRSPEDRLQGYKKNYTPITTYFKSVTDAKITKLGGGKLTTLRANLNYS